MHHVFIKKSTFYNKLIFVILFSLTLFSCTEEIILDIPDAESKLVVNSFVKADEEFKINIEYSQPLFQTENNIISDATVNLWSGDSLFDNLIFDSTNHYISTLKAESGKRYSLTVEHSDYETISVSDSIPLPVNILKGTVLYPAGYDANEDMNYAEATITFRDNLETSDFYEIHIFRHDIQPIVNDSTLQIIKEVDAYYDMLSIMSFDPIIAEEGDQNFYAPTILLSDYLFNGMEHPFKIRFVSDYQESSDYYIVLRSISEDYYWYKKKLIRHIYNQSMVPLVHFEDNMKILFSGSYVDMYSNVDNGYGIFAGFTESELKLEQIQPSNN